MKPNLSTLIDDIKHEKGYSAEGDFTDNQLVRKINSVQYELAQILFQTNPWWLTYYADISAAASAVLPPSFRKIQYVAWRQSSSDPWVKVDPTTIHDIEGKNDTTQVASTGTFRVFYSRVPAVLSYGTADSATSTTVVLAATPSYGETSLENDYYNGATLEIVSATAGSNQTAVITDYTGSTRTATVTFTTTPTGTIVYNVVSDMPEEFMSEGLIQGTIAKVSRDPMAMNWYNDIQARIERFSNVNSQEYFAVEPYEYLRGRSCSYYVRGNTIYFYGE